ncbi:hypothetical protein F4861DRAFT_402537 [Xylaria intraflava]|nr:hypothetical protein F4861DRAFT_402537 [Xylaria intraflava]
MTGFKFHLPPVIWGKHLASPLLIALLFKQSNGLTRRLARQTLLKTTLTQTRPWATILRLVILSTEWLGAVWTDNAVLNRYSHIHNTSTECHRGTRETIPSRITGLRL